MEAHEVRWQGRKIYPSSRELLILNELISNPQRIFTKQHLEILLYGYGHVAESNTIEAFIHTLRKRMSPNAILTVRGIGYKLGFD
ncbi:winged helix-turn-helix domain-containing protein [Salinicola salarius]|uniref:winged helix-turn-helix domain-containing protein n=1 Tax=Salinicola salarius TaxID=430457 RepID=UPI000DA252C9